MSKRVLVTGGNRGLGLEISRQLAQQDLQVFLGSRKQDNGEWAAEKIRANTGAQVKVIQLDTSDADSIQRAVGTLQEQGGIDILVNNAGVMLDTQANAVSIMDLDLNTLQKTFSTNLYGPLQLVQAVLPGMIERAYGRIVNMSSGMGQLSEMGGGYGAYRLSKTALNALTRIFAAEAQQHKNIKINALCPGWVKTDMGGPNANRSVEQGADTAVWLATLAENGPSGLFFRDRQVIPW